MKYSGGIRTFINNTLTIKDINSIALSKLISERKKNLCGSIVICHSYFEFLILACTRCLKGFRIVFIMHSMPRSSNLRNIFKYYFLANFFRISKTKVIFPSKRAAKTYKLLGVDGDVLCHYIHMPSQANKSLKIQPSLDKVYRFLFAGRICKERFFPDLLEIFTIILKELSSKNVEFLIAGSGSPEYINFLKDKKYSNVKYLGNLSQEALQEIDYNCLISLMSLNRSETFGFAIGEAVLANKSIICNSNAGILDHMKVDNIISLSHINKNSVKLALIEALKFSKNDRQIERFILNPEIEDSASWIYKFKKIVLRSHA